MFTIDPIPLISSLPFSIYVIDFLVKSCAIIGLVILAIRLFDTKLANSSKHLLWTVGLFSIALLPFLPNLSGAFSSGQFEASVELTAFRILPEPVYDITTDSFAAVEQETIFSDLILFVYSLLSTYLLARLFNSWWRIRKIHKEAELESKLEMVLSLNQLKRKYNISRPLEIRYSRYISSPLSFGLFYPGIIFPDAAREWDEEVFESALIHELGHIRRLDWLTSTLGYVVCCVYWFNPISWFVLKKMDSEAEASCDSTVLQYGKSSVEYARDLIAITKSCKKTETRPLLAQAIVNRNELKERINLLLNQKTQARMSSKGFLPGLLFVSAMVLASFSFGRILGFDRFSHFERYLDYSFVHFISNDTAGPPRRMFQDSSDSGYIEAQQEIYQSEQSNELVSLEAIRPIDPLPPISRIVPELAYNAHEEDIPIDNFEKSFPTSYRPLPIVLPENRPDFSVDTDNSRMAAVANGFSSLNNDSKSIEHLTRAELERKIEELEEEIVRVFNASTDKRGLRIHCSNYAPTGSYIKKRVCEPQFLTNARSENYAGWARVSAVLETSQGLRSIVAQEFEELTNALNSALEENPYFRKLNYSLQQYRTYLDDLG